MMAHWFEKMQRDAQKQAEQHISSFQDFEHKSNVNISSFAQDILKNNVHENDDLRHSLLAKSKFYIDDFQVHKDDDSLRKVEENFAKLQILDRVVDFQLTDEKIQAKEEQIFHLNRMAQSLEQPRYQNSIQELVNKEKTQLRLLQEEKNAKHQMIRTTIDYYHAEDQVTKHTIEHDFKAKEKNIAYIKEQAKTQAFKTMREFTSDRFHYEALNMASRSRIVPDVERSAMKMAKLNDQQVEFAQKYSFLKKQSQSQIDQVLNKQKENNRSHLEDLFK